MLKSEWITNHHDLFTYFWYRSANVQVTHRATVDEALKAKKENTLRVILFNLNGNIYRNPQKVTVFILSHNVLYSIYFTI